MSTEHSKSEILEELKEIPVGAFSTFDGDKIRSRIMHYAFDGDFNFCFATMKGEPKTRQLALNNSVSFLVHTAKTNVIEDWEVEIQGRAIFINDEQIRKEIIDILSVRSPVVNSLKESGQLNILDIIVLKPRMIKYRIFGEIVQNIPPAVFNFD